jgi:hypothetical protein
MDWTLGHRSQLRARLPKRYIRFLLTAAHTNRILASNDLHSRCPDSPLGLHIVRLLLFLQLRVYDVRPALLTRSSD